METRLWEYIDGGGDARERGFVESLIASDATWRRQYESLLQVHQSLHADISLDQPSLRFTRNVMEEIAQNHIAPAVNSYINKKIVYGIGGFLVSLILGFLVYAIAQVDWSAGSSTGFRVEDLHLEKVFGNQYINVFMIVNSVLGLMLLDRYLTRQKKNWKQKDAGIS